MMRTPIRNFLVWVARRQIDDAANLRKKLVSPPLPPGEVTGMVDNLQQSTIFGTATEEENKKAAAAAVAAKLAASTSSAQMLSSVLSSLVAEEAASISNGFGSSGFNPLFPPEKRPKLEKPMLVSDLTNPDAGTGTSAYFTNIQTSFPPPPPPPPPNVVGGTSSPANQFSQASSGLMMGGMPYAYGGTTLPPPPPLPSHVAMGLIRPSHQPPQPLQQQQQQSQTSGGYYRPPGIGFYGQGHQPTPPPPVPRQ